MAAKILMTGSIMMDLILQMPRIPHPSESLLAVSYTHLDVYKRQGLTEVSSTSKADATLNVLT